MRPRAAVCPLLIVVAVALPGCGDDPPQRERFVATMERFCAAFDAPARRLAVRAVEAANEEGPRYLQAIEPILRESVALNDRALMALRRVPASGHDADLLGQLRDTIADQAGALRRLAAAAAARDRDAFDEVRDEAEALAGRRARLVQRLRIDRCA